MPFCVPWENVWVGWRKASSSRCIWPGTPARIACKLSEANKDTSKLKKKYMIQNVCNPLVTH